MSSVNFETHLAIVETLTRERDEAVETLRDRFAMAALPALVERYAPGISVAAREAYFYADSMMEARK